MFFLQYLQQLSLFQEKDRARDLLAVAEYVETMASELLSIASGMLSAGMLLRATDKNQVAFLDVLIQNEQKECVAHSAVQKYTNEVKILPTFPFKSYFIDWSEYFVTTALFKYCLRLN